MEKDVVKIFVEKRIEDNKELFSSIDTNDMLKKMYLLGLKDGIELQIQQGKFAT